MKQVEMEKPKKVICPFQEDKLGIIGCRAVLFGMALGLMTQNSDRVAKNAGCSPEKAEQYRRFLRYAVDKRFVRAVHGSVLGAVFGATFGGTFIGVHGWLVDKRQILDAHNCAAAGAASCLAASLVRPRPSVRVSMMATAFGAVSGGTSIYPAMKLKLEKQNQIEELKKRENESVQIILNN